MEKSFEEKLEDLRRELSEKQEKACDKLSQKMKEKEKYQFKRKGNELQHTFNEGVKEAIDEALPLLDNPETAERAKQLLKKGSDMIRERQKLIKIADRSDQGWKTADEYEKDPVANDSDDEKRIRKAESAAEKKATKERQKRQVKSRGFRGFRYPTWQREQWRPGASLKSTAALHQQRFAATEAVTLHKKEGAMLQVWSRVSLGTGLPNATSWTPRTSRTVSQHACWETAVRSYHLPVVLYIMYMIVCVSPPITVM